MNFQSLAGVDPLVGVAIVCALYLVMLVWVLTRRRDDITEGAPDRKRWRDLRLWIVPLILIQIALHLIFR
ncbi:MAG: hypothetical protein KC503_09160 [Myxococcales bacterium]|nr:hypothetical protein [Myxococcales bacterium]